MKKFTFAEVVERFRAYNVENNVSYGSPNNVEPLVAVVVYKQSNFDKPYTLEERSYRITSESGKRFFNMPSGSRSIVGNCLDGIDLNVRLDCYDWEVEYCYFEG